MPWVEQSAMRIDIEQEVINISKAVRDSPLSLLLILSEITRLYENAPLPVSLPLDGGGRGGGDFHPSLCPPRAWELYILAAINLYYFAGDVPGLVGG